MLEMWGVRGSLVGEVDGRVDSGLAGTVGSIDRREVVVRDLIAAKFAVSDLLCVVVGPCRTFSNPDPSLPYRGIGHTCLRVTSARRVSRNQPSPRCRDPRLVLSHTPPPPLCCAMATQVETTSVSNGVKTNGKIKSKNQLRRLKAKQKKAAQVRFTFTPFYVCSYVSRST